MNAPNASIASGLYKHQVEGIDFLRRYCGAYRNDIGLVMPRRKSASSNMDTYSQIPTFTTSRRP